MSSGVTAHARRADRATRITFRSTGAASCTRSQTLALGTIAAVALPFALLDARGRSSATWCSIGSSGRPSSSSRSSPRFRPAAGFKRLFSKIALANFIKGLIKLTLIGAVMAVILWPKRHQLDGLVTMDPAVVLPLTKTLSLEMLGTVVAILAIVAAADYLFQYRQWYERQKMSVRELKEEFKQTEGDPAIKAKIRQLRQARAQEAHDGGGAESIRHHHQPDPLRDRIAV